MDALGVLSKVDSEGLLKLEAVVGEFAAYADGDNIVIITPDGERTLPMLRSENSSSRSVADFVDGGAVVRCFALTAGVGLEMVADRDSYEYIMLKLLADRLAEAFAQRLFPRGCRVAFGYPAAPDHSLKRDIFEILSVEKSTSMILTESCMIVPGESICGIHFEQGEFFNVGKIGEEQLADYAARRGMRVDEIKMFIPRSIL
jgi:5-methyltetrahydrofolate--homocysteine methyltransferase